ncbi:unnamed protein product [Heterobilharzia americana]|nr:unnamed protein product [Heterobilharzia americana]
MSKSELACVYAALMLADDDVDVTADKINTILKAANVKFVEPYLPNLFASCLNGRSVKDMLMSMGSAAAAAPSAAPAVASGGADKAQEPAKAEEKKPVSEDESDESMGFDLFG